MFQLLLPNGKAIFDKPCLLLLVFNRRMWWEWKGKNPDQSVIEYMTANYPPDWTYADFGAQFRADLYGELPSDTSLITSIYFRSK